MEIIINDELLDKSSLTLGEFIYLLLLDLNVSSDVIDSLEEKGWLRNGKYTEESRQRFADILNNTKKEPSTDTRIDKLVKNLREIFPKGRKPDTPYYWRCNEKEIKEKLKKFFVYFGNKYSDAQILSAARDYVKSFNGDYRYMRLLKYFIWKSDRIRIDDKTPVELISDLASCIENAGQEERIGSDWTSKLN